MATLTLALLVALLALGLYERRQRRALQAEVAAATRLLRVDIAEVHGAQARLVNDYQAVHDLLRQIRDLNTEELRDRKEVLQHENLTASNRVLQMRKHISDLEDAARRELEGLKRA